MAWQDPRDDNAHFQWPSPRKLAAELGANTRVSTRRPRAGARASRLSNEGADLRWERSLEDPLGLAQRLELGIEVGVGENVWKVEVAMARRTTVVSTQHNSHG